MTTATLGLLDTHTAVVFIGHDYNMVGPWIHVTVVLIFAI
jgi:hypothetical protein